MTNFYYYIGEFGFFSAFVIGALKRLNKTDMRLLTLYDYAKLINHVVDDKITLYYTKDLFTEHRDTYSVIGDSYEMFKRSKFVTYDSGEMFNLPHDAVYTELTSDVIIGLGVNVSMYLDSPDLQFPYLDCPLGENTYIEPSIVIFPRQRKGVTTHRNMDLDVCRLIIDTIKQYNPERRIVQVGHKNEIALLDGIEYVEDIIDAATVIRNCKLLVCPHSGYYYFARNCGVKNTMLIHNYDNGHWIRYFTPFDGILTEFNPKETDNIVNEIKKYLSHL
jgi:hypothetical protein